VNFSTNAGQLSAATAQTDSSGVARTQLTTTREATISANVAGRTAEATVRLNPRTGISISGPTTAVSAGVPTTFTVNVGSDAIITNVEVNFGDGRVLPLGSISGSTTVQHTYTEAGSYTVRAIARDPSGCDEQVATSLTILPGQPPGVTVTASNNRPTVNETVVLTANVTGATSTIQRYEWTFGPGADRSSAVTTGNQVTVSWSTPGTKVITVTVIQSVGPSGNGSTTVTVVPGFSE